MGPKRSLDPGHKVSITLSFLVTGRKNGNDISYSIGVLMGI
jgi:hypothetical protein